jgi:hypothetical protein
MMLIVTLKYVFIILRADNHGEGGSLALLALDRTIGWAKTLDAGIIHARRGGDRALLWRCDHHARNLGPVGGRGARAPCQRLLSYRISCCRSRS